MGEARRRRLIEAARTTRYSKPWPCGNCSADPEDPAYNVVFVVRDGIARCPRCGYANRRAAFGFATFGEPPTTSATQHEFTPRHRGVDEWKQLCVFVNDAGQVCGRSRPNHPETVLR